MIWAALVSALVSVGFHLYLTVQHYELKLGLASGPSACHVNATFNCDSVAVSIYASLFGVPMATWGAWTNLILALLLVLALINLLSDRERVLRMAGGMSLFIALVSLVMWAISTFVLKTYCLFCMGTYLLSFITCGLLWKQTHFLKSTTLNDDLKSLFGSHRWILFTLLAIPAGSFFTKAVFAQQYGLDQIEKISIESLANWSVAPVHNFKQDEGLIYQKGNQTPLMTIVEFADFKCSHCRQAYPTLHSFAESREDVRLIFKPFPLDGTCNKAIQRKGDGGSCDLAYSAFCAEKLSHKGFDLHHWIFDNQERFFETSDVYKVLSDPSNPLVSTMEDIKKCTQTDEIRELIERQANEGAQAKIEGTPTIFVNGKLLERGQFMPVLEKVYQQLKSSK